MEDHDPGRRLEAPTRGPFLALDLGGSRLKAGIVGETNTVEELEIAELPPNADGQTALDAIRKAGNLIASRTPCVGAGLAVPGLVEDDVIASLHGKFNGIVGVHLGAFLTEEFGLEAIVSNDAIAYGVGEAVAGAGQGHRRVVCVTIGTGIGVAVLSDGRPVGTGQLAGGILGGFIPIADDDVGPPDTIGRRGTIESLCAAQRIVDYANISEDTFDSVAEVFAMYMERQPAALEGVRAYRRQLRRALVALAHAHAPDVVVVGGGPLAQEEPIMDGLEQAVNEHLWPGYSVKVRAAALGDGAALVGLANAFRRPR